MSSLNLVPNPAIMVIEAGIFLANLVVVKKFLLEPYLNVHTQRVKLTKGSQELAEKIDAENVSAIDKIQASVQSAAEEGRKTREIILADAKTTRDSTVDKAGKEAKQIVDAMRKELAQEIEMQRQKIPGVVSELSRQLLDKIVPA
jgi:F0F1-type ATP synthase membrane subunit b/b'